MIVLIALRIILLSNVWLLKGQSDKIIRNYIKLL